VAVFDRDLVSRFEWLRHLHHGDVATPPLYMAFDLLRLADQDYRSEPLKIRRRALEKLIRGQTLILPARRLSPNGFAAWAEVLHRGYEGMVAKDPAAPYVGGRSLKWLKVKVPKYREEERGFLQALALAPSPTNQTQPREDGSTSLHRVEAEMGPSCAPALRPSPLWRLAWIAEEHPSPV
jgi:hypothetical protein